MKSRIASSLVVALLLWAIPSVAQNGTQGAGQAPKAAGSPASSASQNQSQPSAGTQQEAPTAKAAQATPPPKSTPPRGKKAEAPVDDAFVIGPDDVLAIDVWQEKELSERVDVRPDGKITMPLINEVQAAGLKPTELKEVLEKALAKYVTDPHVSVIVDQINSRFVYISGEVNKPGILPLVRSTTVLQALTLVGGPNQFANTKKIYVMRTVNGKTVKYPFDYKRALKEGPGKDDIVLQPGDTIVVP